MRPSIAYRHVRLGRRLALLGSLLAAVVATAPPPVHAQGNKPAPDEMRWGVHVTLVSRWLDPAETEAFSTPFMVMYAMHDAMVRPMPAGLNTPVYAYGSLPEIDDLYARQARELDIKKREALVHDIQKIIREKVTDIPLFEQAFIWGVGPRVEEAGDGRIAGFSYSAPFEDLKLKKQ